MSKWSVWHNCTKQGIIYVAKNLKLNCGSGILFNNYNLYKEILKTLLKKTCHQQQIVVFKSIQRDEKWLKKV